MTLAPPWYATVDRKVVQVSFGRVAGWAGVVAVLLGVLSLVFGGSPPDSGDSVAKVGEFVAEDNGLHKTGLFFGFLIGVPFVIFLAGFLVPVFKSDREHGEAYGVVVFAGALLVGAGAGVGDIASAALHLRGGEQLGAEGTRVLYDVVIAGYSSTGIAFAILGLGAAMVILKRKVWANWVGWLAALLAVVGPLGLFGMLSGSSLSNFGFVPFLTFLVWLLATGIEMIRSKETAVALPSA
jgi:hypothetical protein